MDIKDIFLIGLIEPNYSRVEFWQIKQRESGFSRLTFWIKLNDVWQSYYNHIKSKIEEINSLGNKVTDYRLALFTETKGIIQKGHLGIPELEELRLALYEYGFQLQQNLWPYEYDMSNIHTDKSNSPAKNFKIIRLLNEGRFVNELKEKQPEEIGNFLSFHLRCYKRKIKNAVNREELEVEWFKNTRKHLPSDYSSKQKDFFLLWFEQIEQAIAQPERPETEQVEATIEELKAFFEEANLEFAEAEESFIKGFEPLHQYIIQNVNNDLWADLTRLQQLERNLLNWKVQLEYLFNGTLNSGWKQKTKRIIAHVDGALRVIRLRIKGKERILQRETKIEEITVEVRPALKPDAVQTVFEIIKDYFNPDLHTELKQILETGDKARKKLLFKGNGNRLTDTFKKLIEYNFITGCHKKDLIEWIISNFTFLHQKRVSEFKRDTVGKIISRNHIPCKSPLIEIKKGQIEKVEEPRKRKRNKY